MIKGNEMKLEATHTVTVNGIDACFDMEMPGEAPVIPIIENEEDWLKYMAGELGPEKLCEMAYEEGLEPEIYA